MSTGHTGGPTGEPAAGAAAEQAPRAALTRRLWGETAPARRGPRPTLSTARVVDAALDLADAEGLAAVSMSRIAKALDCTPMALYRHVSHKEELLVLMADAVSAPAPVVEEAAGWRAGLRQWTRAQIELLIARPWYLDLAVTVTPPGPNRVRWLDVAFGILEPVALPPDEKLSVIGLLAQHTIGEARVHVESAEVAAAVVRAREGLPDDVPASRLDPAALRAANPYTAFEATLMRHADRADYPHLFAAFEAPGSGTAIDAAEEDMDFGIDILLDGLEAYFRRRGAID